MRIKTFQGKSLEEMLPEIRAELGASAVVLGQRQKVQGGIGGFFGTKVLEVTAADRMPSDEQLVDLEGRMMDGTLASTEDEKAVTAGVTAAAPAPEGEQLADRFRGAMRMGRAGGIDVTDDWDPSTDAELAEQYGRVLEHARLSAGVAPTADGRLDIIEPEQGFTPLDVPVVPTEAASIEPAMQAQVLAQRAHEEVRRRTERVEAVSSAGTYAPPVAMPGTGATTFTASVIDHGTTTGADLQATTAQPTAPLTADLAVAPVGTALPTSVVAAQAQDAIAEAIAAAVDVIDVRAMAALRNAMNANRSIIDGTIERVLPAALQRSISLASTRLEAAGVDDDVIAAVIDATVKHRIPFASEQAFDELLREVVEEYLPVRSGFTSIGRTHRVAIVGSPTCGKTSVVQKLAQRYAESGVSVGIIVLIADATGVGSADQGIRSTGVDVRYAATPRQAAEAAEAFAHHDLVLVDTPGLTYLDGSIFDSVQGCLAAIGVDDVQVVVPLTTSTREASSIVEAFRPLGANRLIVSRMDESRHMGQLLNFGFRLGLPMTYLTDGHVVPTDMQAASPRAIAAMIFPTADDDETSHKESFAS